MNTRMHKRVLAGVAVVGVAVLGPVTTPVSAAPGGNSGHAKADHGKAGQPAKSHAPQGKAGGHSTAGSGTSRGQVNGHTSAPRPQPSGGHASSASQGQAKGHSTGASQGRSHGNGTAGGSAPGSSPSAGAGKGPQAGHGAPAGKSGQADKGGKGGDPAGNNGTVKIETVPIGNDAPNNVPHVGCTFQLEWYGFDEGEEIISTVDFQMHSPTSDVVLGGYEPTEVFVGGDPASGAGTGSGFDGRQVYTLSFDGEPHPQQGYHVKLTIHTPGSQGADTKHKVFWVEPCEELPPGEEEPPGGEEETPPGTPEVEGEQETDRDREDREAGDIEVAGEQQVAPVSPAEVPTAVDAGVATAVSAAATPWSVLLVGLGALLAGLGFLLRRRHG